MRMATKETTKYISCSLVTYILFLHMHTFSAYFASHTAVDGRQRSTWTITIHMKWNEICLKEHSSRSDPFQDQNTQYSIFWLHDTRFGQRVCMCVRVSVANKWCLCICTSILFSFFFRSFRSFVPSFFFHHIYIFHFTVHRIWIIFTAVSLYSRWGVYSYSSLHNLHGNGWFTNIKTVRMQSSIGYTIFNRLHVEQLQNC